MLYTDLALPVYNNSNYNIADKIITTSKKEDITRELGVQKIILENQFYVQFRTEIREQLSKPNAKVYIERIYQIIDHASWSYQQKLKAMITLLHVLIGRKIVFNTISDEVLYKFNKLNCTDESCRENPLCIRKENGVCKIISGAGAATILLLTDS